MSAYRSQDYSAIHEDRINQNIDEPMIWNEQFNLLSSLINPKPQGTFIYVTSQPCIQRKQFVEEVLNEKQIPFMTYFARSHTTLSDILTYIVDYISSMEHINSVVLTPSEILIDIKSLYTEKNIQNYLIIENFDCLPMILQDHLFHLSEKIAGIGLIGLGSIHIPSQIDAYIHVDLPLLSIQQVLYIYTYQLTDKNLVKFISLVINCLYIYIHNLMDLDIYISILYSYIYQKEENKENIDLLSNPLYQYIFKHIYTNIYPLHICNTSDSQGKTDNLKDEMIDISQQDLMEGIDIYSYCGVEFSFNTKLLIIASYLCSIYDESCDEQFVEAIQLKKKKGKRKQYKKPSPISIYTFSINRLIFMYRAILSTIDKGLISSLASLHSQINMLICAGIFIHTRGNISVDNDMYNETNTFKCAVSERDVIQLANNIQYPLKEYLASN